MYDQIQEAQDAQTRIQSLNPEQLEAFNRIMEKVDNNEEPTKCFYLDGPGGSGKTYLYAMLMAHIRGRGQIALTFATSGIAATLNYR